MTQLNRTENQALAECESVIERGLATFVEVGQALLRIRDERLYRTYKTFEEYCKERWKWGRNYVNKQIAAAEVVKNLGTNVPNVKGITEGQMRELTPLPPPQQREIATRAIQAFNGKLPPANVLAQMVREERQKRGELPPPEPEPSREELDRRRNLRAQMQRNSEYNHKVWKVIHAIEALSQPELPLEEIASQIRWLDSPDKDWCGHAQNAAANLHCLAKELKS
jgi:hypothetical protein